MIPFNKPFLTGKETMYIEEAVASGKLSGNGIFTKKCHHFFESRYGFKKCLLTTSCTDALEMCAMLLNIKKDDEIIIPSYTFVSTAIAFVRQGAKIIFADSYSDNPNIDPEKISQLITPKTKAIVVVHYGGIACDMDEILKIAKVHNLYVIEDAAQAIDSFYKGKPLGTIGHLSTFSFHETKNIISGEGGMLCINDENLIEIHKNAYHIKATGTGYGWPIISAVMGQLMERMKSAQSDEKKILISKRYIKPAMLFATLNFKGREELVQSILKEIDADLKKIPKHLPKSNLCV